MPIPILRGTNEPQLQYFEINFEPTRGSTMSKEFKGTSYNKMAALAAQYGAARWAGTLRSEMGISTLKLTGTSTGGLGNGTTSPVADISDKWEISVDQEKPDLCENPNFRSFFSGLDSAWASTTGRPNSVSETYFSALRSVASSDNATWSGLRAKLDATKLLNVNGDEVATSPPNASVNAIIGVVGIYPNLLKFVDDYLRGSNVFVRGKYVLRHTTNAPSDYSANIADYGVEKIYSIAQLLTEVQSSALWILPLPGYLAYKINTYAAPTSMPASYQWGALKLRSGATTAALGRIDITTEYLIDAWPVHTYGTI